MTPTPGDHPCPSRLVDRNTATTAMVLADAAGPGGLQPGHRLWLHIEGWAAGLGLIAPGALAQACQPPGRVGAGKDAAVPPDREAAGS